jgi:hypothetical protein
LAREKASAPMALFKQSQTIFHDMKQNFHPLNAEYIDDFSSTLAKKSVAGFSISTKSKKIKKDKDLK